MSCSTKAAVEIHENKPRNAQVDSARYETKLRLRKKLRYERKIENSDTVSGARRRSVSGNFSQTAIPAPAPNNSSSTKFERQPNAVCSTPPISGARIGAIAMIAESRDISRATRLPS